MSSRQYLFDFYSVNIILALVENSTFKIRKGYIMKKIIGLAAASLILTSGCATILTEETHKINVTTTSGETTTVTVDGMSQTVPGVVTVKKENKDKVLVADDAKCTDVNLNKEVESAFFINILSGGVFGSSTDYGSDKMWKYQDSVSVPCK